MPTILNGQVASATDILRGMTSSGFIRFDELISDTNKTIAGGVLLPTSNMVFISPESGTRDDLDTITATSPLVIDDGSLMLAGVFGSADNEITLKHNTGNIICPEGRDILLHETPSGLRNSLAILVYKGTKWIVVACNTMTPEQTLFNHMHFS